MAETKTDGNARRERILILVKQLSDRPIDPQPDESLFGSGLLDSFALLDLVSFIESEFGVRIADDELNPRTFDSVFHIESFLDARI
jgi:acyl carrier protein